MSSEKDSTQLRDEAKDRYKMFIANPPSSDKFAFELDYVTEEGWDKPLIYNTWGMNLFNSLSSEVGEDDIIELSDEFFDTVAFSYHHVMATMAQISPKRLESEIDYVIGIFYEDEDGNVSIPSHEEWAIYNIVPHLVYRKEVFYEFGPIVRYADTVTEFGVPDVMPRD